MGKKREPGGNIGKAAKGGQTTSGWRAEIPGTRASFPYAFGVTSTGRYPHEVLASGWQSAGRPTSTDLALAVGLVLEDATSGFCGAVLRWERGLVILEDRHGEQADLRPRRRVLVRGKTGRDQGSVFDHLITNAVPVDVPPVAPNGQRAREQQGCDLASVRIAEYVVIDSGQPSSGTGS